MVHFPRGDFWVARKSLGKYALWVSGRHLGSGDRWRGIGQYILRPSGAESLPPHVRHLLERACSLDVHPGWLRGQGDGSRIQVFDLRGDRVAHLAVGDSGRRLMRRELWARQRAGDLAPGILKSSSDGSGYVEKWVKGRIPACSETQLHSLLQQLRDRFYRLRQVSFSGYQRKLSRLGPLEPLEAAAFEAIADTLSGQPFLVSWVHGDLWSENVCANRHGQYVLLDWEYTRPSLITADAWFYLYHYYRIEGDDPGRFFRMLSAAFRRLWHVEKTENLLAHHLFHLVERRIFLRSIREPLPAQFASLSERDIRSALASYNHPLCLITA